MDDLEYAKACMNFAEWRMVQTGDPVGAIEALLRRRRWTLFFWPIYGSVSLMLPLIMEHAWSIGIACNVGAAVCGIFSTTGTHRRIMRTLDSLQPAAQQGEPA